MKGQMKMSSEATGGPVLHKKPSPLSASVEELSSFGGKTCSGGVFQSESLKCVVRARFERRKKFSFSLVTDVTDILFYCCVLRPQNTVKK